MKTIKLLAVCSALGLALVGWNSRAQGAPPAGNSTDMPMGNGMGPGKMQDKPDRPRPQLPDDVKKMIADAQAAQKAFRAAQVELAKQLKDATATARDKIKADMKALRDKFREDQKARMEEIHARMKELRDEFKSTHPTAADAAAGRGGHGRGR